MLVGILKAMEKISTDTTMDLIPMNSYIAKGIIGKLNSVVILTAIGEISTDTIVNRITIDSEGIKGSTETKITTLERFNSK